MLNSSEINVSNLSNKLSLISGRFSDFEINLNSFLYIDNYGDNNGLYSISNMGDQTITVDTNEWLLL